VPFLVSRKVGSQAPRAPAWSIMATSEFVRKARLLSKVIEKAFAHVRYPGDSALLHPSDSDAKAEVRGFQGKAWASDWRKIPCETIEENYCSLLFLSPTAFRFFLPAYMTCALTLEYGDRSSEVLSFTLYCLNPEVDEQAFLEHFLGQVAGFTAQQKEAVRLFLELIRDEHDDESLRREAIDGLERYWSGNRSLEDAVTCESENRLLERARLDPEG